LAVHARDVPTVGYVQMNAPSKIRTKSRFGPKTFEKN